MSTDCLNATTRARRSGPSSDSSNGTARARPEGTPKRRVCAAPGSNFPADAPATDREGEGVGIRTPNFNDRRMATGTRTTYIHEEAD